MTKQEQKEYKRQYHILHKEERKHYIQQNKDKIKEQKRIYFQKYKIRYRKIRNKYEKHRRQVDKHYHILMNLRGRIYKSLKGLIKKDSTVFLLGCSIKYLKYYLEKQFNTKMSWKNYGKYWEIDHIIPCSYFDLSKLSEQKRCFSYKNLRPLFKKTNRRKSDNLIVKIDLR
jgi:hypothetical protein